MSPSKRRIEEEEEEDRSSSDEEISDTQNPNKSYTEGVDASSSDEEMEEEAVEGEKEKPIPSPSANATSDDDTTDDDVSVGDDVVGGVLAESDSDTIPSLTAPAFKIQPSKSILSLKSVIKEAKKTGNPNSNSGPILKSGAKEAEKKGNPNSGQSILALRSGAKEAEKKRTPNPRLSEQKRSPLIWTEDAEVAVLKGLVEFRAKKGIDPSSNGDVFYLFIQKMIPFEFSRTQLMEKVRRLKKKYENNALKGDSVVFARPHESKLFELSKKFWDGVVDNGVKNGKRKAEGSVEREGGGVKSAKKLEKQEKSGGVEGLVEKSAKRLKNKENNGSVEGSVEKSSKKAKKESLDVVNEDVNQTVVQNGVSDEGLVSLDVSGVWDMYPRLKMAIDKESFGYFSEEVNRSSEVDLSQTGHAKAKELEGKWKLYKAKETELRMMWLDIVREQMKFVVEELAKP